VAAHDLSMPLYSRRMATRAPSFAFWHTWLMTVSKLLSLAALLGSIAWLVVMPGFEPALAVMSSLTALVATSHLANKRKRSLSQNQTLGKGSTGIQAGGNVTISNDSQRIR